MRKRGGLPRYFPSAPRCPPLEQQAELRAHTAAPRASLAANATHRHAELGRTPESYHTRRTFVGYFTIMRGSRIHVSRCSSLVATLPDSRTFVSFFPSGLRICCITCALPNLGRIATSGITSIRAPRYRKLPSCAARALDQLFLSKKWREEPSAKVSLRVLPHEVLCCNFALFYASLSQRLVLGCINADFGVKILTTYVFSEFFSILNIGLIF